MANTLGNVGVSLLKKGIDSITNEQIEEVMEYGFSRLGHFFGDARMVSGNSAPKLTKDGTIDKRTLPKQQRSRRKKARR